MAGTSPSHAELVEDALQSLSERRDRVLELADAPKSQDAEERMVAEGLGIVLDLAAVIGNGALAIADAQQARG